LNVGDSISDTFTVTAADGTTTSVQVTINGTNDAAVVSSAAVNVDETDAPITTTGTLTVSDVDNVNEFTPQTNTAGTYGTFSIDSKGDWIFPYTALFRSLNVGDSISDTFTVTAADGTTTSVQVTINGTNDAAVVSSAVVDVDETDAPITTTGTLTVSNAEERSVFKPQTYTAGTYGSCSIDSNGNWTYTANAAYDYLNVGDSISDTFTVTADDGTATSVQVTINGTNDAAVVSSDVVAVDETNAPITTTGTLTIS